MASNLPPEIRDGYRPAMEHAPSEMVEDPLSTAKLVGMVGGLATVFGLVVVMLYRTSGTPRLVPEWLGWLTLLGGLGALLYYGARDPDLQIRRSYGLASLALLGIALALTLWPDKRVEGGIYLMRTYFLPYGFALLILALFFALPFLRHETDPAWRQPALGALAGVGAAGAAAGVVGSVVSVDFLLGPGIPLATAGLTYLFAYITQVGTGQGGGYLAGLGVGVAGALLTLYALGRSILPPLFYDWGWITSAPDPFLVPSGVLLFVVGVIYTVLALGICSDSPFVVLTRRELSAFFYSPIAYIVLFSLSLIGWFQYRSFVREIFVRSVLVDLGSDPLLEPIVRSYFVDLIPVLLFLPLIPLLTMRLLSEEKRTGTLEVLLTSPVNELQVVLSKFFASLMFYVLVWLPSGLFLVALRVEGGKPFDFRPLISFYLALVFSGAGFLAMGLFFSSVTRNQIVAFVLGLGGMAVFFLFYQLSRDRETGQAWTTIFRHLSFIDLWIDSLAGRFKVRDALLHGSLAVFWLFLTVKVLEARKWR